MAIFRTILTRRNASSVFSPGLRPGAPLRLPPKFIWGSSFENLFFSFPSPRLPESESLHALGRDPAFLPSSFEIPCSIFDIPCSLLDIHPCHPCVGATQCGCPNMYRHSERSEESHHFSPCSSPITDYNPTNERKICKMRAKTF